MQINSRVDCFTHLKRHNSEQQQALLAEAKNEAVKHPHYDKTSTASLILGHLITIFVALVPPYILGFSLTVNGAFLGLGLIVSGFMTDWLDQRLKARLLKKGLERVLARQSSGQLELERAVNQSAMT